MASEFESNYRAFASKDGRFDGRIFAGVVTTGVYCRPICPAPMPKRENVRFFPCAAAAEEAGFRPCRRCRPETSPGTPAWLGTSATVSRALRLISAGELDRKSVEEMAPRLGIGGRHLRRLFADHLGTTPVAIAQTRRTHFARKLIDETRLPMTQVALGAGFASVRRFNSAIRAAFGKSPSELRRAVRTNGAASGGEFVFKLPYRPPFDWSLVIRFLEPRATPGVESVTDDAYRRTVRIGDAPGVIEVRPVEGKSHLVLRARLDSSAGLLETVERTRRIFDLGADPLEIASHLRRDPLMKRLVKARPGLRVPGAWDEFELAVRAILGQQVSVKGATTLAGRLVERFGTPLEEPDGELTHVFPAPETLADADLGGIGLVAARAAAVRELSRAVCDGAVTLDSLTGLDEFCEQMTRLPGIGQWTAHYIAMRALREPDALPASDLGLRRAAGDGDKPITEAQLNGRAEAWRPWRAYAAMHLWMSETKKRKAACK